MRPSYSSTVLASSWAQLYLSLHEICRIQAQRNLVNLGFYPQAADWTEGLGQSTDRAALDTTRTCLCEISDHYRYRPGASLHLPALSAVDNYPVYGL